MTHSVQELLNDFERLSREEQHFAAVEILRRVDRVNDELPEDVLDALGAELFHTLDEAEAVDAKP